MALFMAMVAYCYTPVGHSPDIIEYYTWMDNIVNLSIKRAWFYAHTAGKTNLRVFNIILWLIAKTGDYHLLPAISTFFVYYICFYLTCDFAVRNQISLKYAAQYMLFAVMALNYYGIVNNVRNILAFALVALAIYRDVCLNKRNAFTYFLYVFPIFLHSSAILIVAVRFVVMLPSVWKLIFAVATTLIMPVTGLLYGYIGLFSGSGIINTTITSFIRTSYWYFRNTNSAWAVAVAKSGSQRLKRILYISLVVIMCVCIIMYQWKKRNFFKDKASTGKQKMYDAVVYFGLITIACAPMPMPEYWRFASLFLITGGMVFVPIFSEKTAVTLKQLSRVIMLIAPLCMVLWARDFINCDRSALIAGILVMNPVIIFIKDCIQALMG